jgi:putative flippase GtrA
MDIHAFRKNLVISSEFWRFCIVGASGTTLDYLILTMLVFSGWETLWANVVSYSAGVINNYFWNHRWTFRSHRSTQSLEQFSQFTIISLIGLGVNTTIVLLLSPLFAAIPQFSDFHLIFSKGVATSVVLFWNYFANKIWTFNTINR